MNREARMRKRWLPKETKQKEPIFNWMKAAPLILGLIIGIIILIVIALKWPKT